MTTDCIRFELGMQGGRKRHITIVPDERRSSSDGGLLLLARIERRRSFIDSFSRCFLDHRRQDLVTHSLKDLLTQRVFGLCHGYEGINDHDLWWTDPLLGPVCGRGVAGAGDVDTDPLAGKSTLNRLELGRGKCSETDRYKRIEWDEVKIRQFFVDAVEAHRELIERSRLFADSPKSNRKFSGQK